MGVYHLPLRPMTVSSPPLARSPFRSRFELSEKEQAYLEQKGMAAILQHARAFIQTRLARTSGPRRQTNPDEEPPGFRGPACHGHLLSKVPGHMARYPRRQASSSGPDRYYRLRDRAMALPPGWLFSKQPAFSISPSKNLSLKKNPGSDTKSGPGRLGRMICRFSLYSAGAVQARPAIASRRWRRSQLTGPQGPALIFLVPEQATYQAETHLLSHPRDPGFSPGSSVSFDRLRYLLVGRGSARRRLSEVGRQMIVPQSSGIWPRI